MKENLPFGLPSFDEFRKNPEKFLGRKDDLFASVDKGSNLIDGYITKYIYEVGGYRCKNLEECEQVAASMGYGIQDLDIVPEIIPDAGLKCKVLVRFLSKESVAKRRTWK